MQQFKSSSPACFFVTRQNRLTKLSLLPAQGRAQQGQALPASCGALQQTVLARVQPSYDLQTRLRVS